MPVQSKAGMPLRLLAANEDLPNPGETNAGTREYIHFFLCSAFSRVYKLNTG